MMHPSWARDGTRRAIIVNRGCHDVSPSPVPSGWGRQSPPPWLRPSTPPPPPTGFFTPTSWAAAAGDLSDTLRAMYSTPPPQPAHFLTPTSWAPAPAAGSQLDTPRAVYTPSATSPLLLPRGSGLRGLPSWSQGPGARPFPQYQRTSTSTSSLASSPPSESFATSPSPPRSVLAPTAGPCSAFRELDDHHLLQQDLPAFGARTAAAASATSAEVSGSPVEMPALSAFSQASLEPPTTDAIDNLVALTQILCLTDDREQSEPLQPSKRNNVKGRGRSPRNYSIYCAFCKGNGELRALYSSHRLHVRFPDGTFRVQCPVLRNLRCEICGATGDYAHTRSHCPENTQPSVAVMLKEHLEDAMEHCALQRSYSYQSILKCSC